MIKKYLNCFVALVFVTSTVSLFADSNSAEDVAILKNDVSEIQEKLTQAYLNDAEISGSKKEAGLRLINQAKIDDATFDKLMNDSEISESKKSKIMKKLKKLTDEAKVLSNKLE